MAKAKKMKRGVIESEVKQEETDRRSLNWRSSSVTSVLSFTEQQGLSTN